jgi:hypothetical protein
MAGSDASIHTHLGVGGVERGDDCSGASANIRSHKGGCVQAIPTNEAREASEHRESDERVGAKRTREKRL